MSRTEQTKGAATKSAATGVCEAVRAGAASLGKSAKALAAATDSSTALASLRKLRGNMDELVALSDRLATIEADLVAEVDRAFAELDSDLRAEFAARGWECHGQWPTLRVAMGVDISIDEAKRSATVGARKVPGADLSAILQALQPQVEALVPSGFDVRSFVADLAAAYDAMRGENAVVPAFELYRAFVVRSQKAAFWRNAVGTGFVGVSADQFRARLSRAMAQGRTKLADGRSLRLLPSIDPRDAMFVYLPDEDRFALIGRIGFAAD